MPSIIVTLFYLFKYNTLRRFLTIILIDFFIYFATIFPLIVCNGTNTVENNQRFVETYPQTNPPVFPEILFDH